VDSLEFFDFCLHQQFGLHKQGCCILFFRD